MAKKNSKVAAASSSSAAPAAAAAAAAITASASPPAKKAKQIEDGVAKQTTRYHETPSIATSTAAPLLAPSEPAIADGPSFGDLLADQHPSTLAPLPATTSSSATGRPTPLSLSRLLTQALHSSDTPLLNSCLSHSDPKLIGSTVRRLQPELTVPLLERLSERLALGGKARQGGASAQRVRGVCTWLKVTLREKLGYLSTVPGLVGKLEPLHRLVNERLAMTAPLMGLAGRLELALAQVELRASTAEEDEEEAEGRKGARYVEGESSDEESDSEDEVALEEGEVEDVGLGGESDEEEDDDDDSEGAEDDSADDDDDSGADALGPNGGFVDDEASEEGSEAGDEDDLSDSE